MNRYAIGRRLEYKAQAHLRAEGFECMRSAGSKGLFDIVAWNGKIIRFIQSKSKHRACKDEILEIHLATVPPNGIKELWIWKFRVADPVIEVIP